MENIRNGLLTVFLALLVMMTTVFPASAIAGTAAERTLPASVAPGEDFTVTVDVSNYGTLGRVVETLPAGFDFVSQSGALSAAVNGNEVTFNLLGTSSFSYTVTAASGEGTYDFAGSIIDEDFEVSAVVGDPSIEVVSEGTGGPGGEVPVSGAAVAVRTLPASVASGEDFTVTMTVSDYGTLGRVVETLPAGFDYVDQSGALSAAVDGNEVTFNLLGTSSFSYTVTAASGEGTYDFAGSIIDEDFEVSAVVGDPSIEVVSEGTGGPGGEVPVSGAAVAVRTLPASVASGEDFTVTMAVSDYGALGRVVETLPAGFDYVDQSGALSAAVDGNEVTFNLLGTSSFSYTVTAASGEGTYDFAGTIIDEDLAGTAVIGDPSIEVVAEAGGEIPVVGTSAASRTLPASVTPGEEFIVTVDVSDFGALGRVAETLPAGFEYVDQTGAFFAEEVGNEVTFTVMVGTSSFSYTVTAASGEGTYDFVGTLEDSEHAVSTVGGDTQISVGDEVIPDSEGIVIEPGWNFISVPCALNNSDVELVLADINYHTVMYWNAASGIWEVPTEIEPLKGYWIKSNEEDDQIISVDCLEPLVPAVPATITVYPGWNAIGYTESSATLTAEMVFSSIDDSYTLIKGPYDPATMTYEQIGHNGETGVISGSHVGTDVFEMNPYEGYWIYVLPEDTMVGF